MTFLPPDKTPHCLQCQTHIDYADGLLEEIEQVNYRLRRAERENYRLRTAGAEETGKKGAKLLGETREWLERWDEDRRKHFPTARNIKVDTESTRAKRYQKARKTWSHEDLMLCLRGLELSPWHTSNAEYFEPKSFLREDERIEKHIQRANDYERLRAAGWDDARARALIHAGVDREAHEDTAKDKRRCPGCGRNPDVEGCFCATVVEAAVAGSAA